jgi:cellulose synthase/poly-beta-1,6-N-acetylglucosamine synthase-like glycosyltransferase
MAARALWTGLGLVAYTYVGYPALIGAAARRRRARRAAESTATAPPTLSVVIAALDEEAVIREKIRDTRAQDYPRDRLEIVVVADGSRDSTADIARAEGAIVLHAPEPRGKSAAVNCGIAVATGDVVCLTDANCALSPVPCERSSNHSPTPRSAS